MEEIQFEKEVRDKLISGINKASKAVAKTMGPKGSTVIIADKDIYGQYKVTKDGVSVINSIKLKDAVENIGVSFLRQAANLTVDQAGDGTTTATVLASAFINNLKDFKSTDINKAFDEIIPKVLEQLKLNSKELKHEDIRYVATISANNDIQIGNIIQQAYNHANIVKIEESEQSEDTLETVTGMQLKVSYLSKDFVNDEHKGECNFTEPHVLILDGKLENLKPFDSIIQYIAQAQEPLLIICEEVHESIMRVLRAHVINSKIKLCIIKSPGFGLHRKDLLKDLASFTGGSVISDFNKSYNTTSLGKLESCKITKNYSILVKEKKDIVNIHLSNLICQTNIKGLTKQDIDLLEQRIENLTGKVSIIKVGGTSSLDMKERFDRYDDAVKAVACALEEGIVEGGGISLCKIWTNPPIIYNENNMDIHRVLYRCFTEPFKIINENQGNVLESKIGLHFDKINMFKQNIIDPLKVTRCALENAVSVAKTILSTEAVVLHELEWNRN